MHYLQIQFIGKCQTVKDNALSDDNSTAVTVPTVDDSSITLHNKQTDILVVDTASPISSSSVLENNNKLSTDKLEIKPVEEQEFNENDDGVDVVDTSAMVFDDAMDDEDGDVNDNAISFIEQILERKLKPDEFRKLAQELKSPSASRRCSFAGGGRRRSSIGNRRVSFSSDINMATKTPVGLVSSNKRFSMSPSSCTNVIEELRNMLSSFIPQQETPIVPSSSEPNVLSKRRVSVNYGANIQQSLSKSSASSSQQPQKNNAPKVSYKFKGFTKANEPVAQEIATLSTQEENIVQKEQDEKVTNKSPVPQAPKSRIAINRTLLNQRSNVSVSNSKTNVKSPVRATNTVKSPMKSPSKMGSSSKANYYSRNKKRHYKRV